MLGLKLSLVAVAVSLVSFLSQTFIPAISSEPAAMLSPFLAASMVLYVFTQGGWLFIVPIAFAIGLALDINWLLESGKKSWILVLGSALIAGSILGVLALGPGAQFQISVASCTLSLSVTAGVGIAARAVGFLRVRRRDAVAVPVDGLGAMTSNRME